MTTTKRRGQLIHTGKGYSARLERGGKLIRLGTNDRAVAEQRLADLMRGATPAAACAPAVETFQSACERICAAAERDGMVTAKERLSRLRRYTWPALGSLAVTEIKSGQISDVLAAAAVAGDLSQDTVNHLQVDMVVVFGELVRDEILTRNPATGERIRLPLVGRDERKRTLLEDGEFLQLVAAPTTPAQIRAMAWTSRAFGGLRPSDMYAWIWEDIDTATWQSALAPRQKTERSARRANRPQAKRERLALPPEVAAVLQQWHRTSGRPAAGLVFPLVVENLARELRRALAAAGVTRKEVLEDTPTSRRTDFYSLRRAYVTALAESGVNAQLAMRMAGHKSMTTHMRYVVADQLEAPSTTVPRAPRAADPEECPDFATALESFDPAAELCSGVVPWLSSKGLLEEFQALGFTELISSRPHRELNPSSRRERPSEGTRTDHEPCQDKTKISGLEAILSLFGGNAD